MVLLSKFENRNIMCLVYVRMLGTNISHYNEYAVKIQNFNNKIPSMKCSTT